MKTIIFIFCVLIIFISCTSLQKRDIKENSAPSEETIVTEDTVPKTMVEEILDHYLYMDKLHHPDREDADSVYYFNLRILAQDSCYYIEVSGNENVQHFLLDSDDKPHQGFIGYASVGKYYVAIDWTGGRMHGLKGRKESQIPSFLEGIKYLDAEFYINRYINSFPYHQEYDPYYCMYKIKDNSFTFEKEGFW